MKSNNYLLKLSAFLLLSISVISSCKKDDDHIHDLEGTGSLVIEFDNRANGSALILSPSSNYTNENGDQMSFSQFDYYVSNFQLVKSDGTVFTVPKDSCYFLIKQSDSDSREIQLNNIPAGDYTSVRFIVGIDSAKSLAPASERIGVLDIAGEGADMYWSWNSGYIFVKCEGNSPQSTQTDQSFRYHIGLFGGGYGTMGSTLNNIKQISLTDADGDKATVRKDIMPHVHLLVDVMQMFKTPTAVSVATNSVVMASPFSANIAANYADMFTLDHIHN